MVQFQLISLVNSLLNWTLWLFNRHKLSVDECGRTCRCYRRQADSDDCSSNSRPGSRHTATTYCPTPERASTEENGRDSRYLADRPPGLGDTRQAGSDQDGTKDGRCSSTSRLQDRDTSRWCSSALRHQDYSKASFFNDHGDQNRNNCSSDGGNFNRHRRRCSKTRQTRCKSTTAV